MTCPNDRHRPVRHYFASRGSSYSLRARSPGQWPCFAGTHRQAARAADLRMSWRRPAQADSASSIPVTRSTMKDVGGGSRMLDHARYVPKSTPGVTLHEVMARLPCPLTRKRSLVQSQYRPPAFQQVSTLQVVTLQGRLLWSCPILGAKWERILAAGSRWAARRASRAGTIERADSRARSRRDVSHRSCSIAFRPARMAGLTCP